LYNLITNTEAAGSDQQIIMNIRTPRVLSAGLVGIALALSGATMQGVLKNPLADGSTLGVSAGGSLGAVIAIVTGFSVPFLPFSGVVILAIVFSFLSMLFILWATYRIDRTLSNASLILMGIVFSMFVNSLISLLLVFFEEQMQQIIFWTMGSLSGTTYQDVLMLFVTVLVFGGLILIHAEEVNAFSLGEDQARNLGVDVKKVRLILLVSVSALIGTAVAISGTIGFVGLVVPHIARILVGPNHKHLYPMAIMFGAIFLMLTDLVARTIASPVELPIGVITSFIGAIVFIFIFRNQKRGV
jgi:iron complex transport system permease protein